MSMPVCDRPKGTRTDGRQYVDTKDYDDEMKLESLGGSPLRIQEQQRTNKDFGLYM